MDDKVFYFLVLIPGFLLLMSYLVIRHSINGKKIFIICAVALAVINIIHLSVNSYNKESELNFKAGIIYIFTLYCELLAFFVFALIYGIIKKNN